MTYPNVCILTEGGGSKGLGHVYRSITLATQLPGATLEIKGKNGIGLELALDAGIELGQSSDAEVLVRDLSPDSLQAAARTPANGLVVDICDDSAECSGEADLVIASLYTPAASVCSYDSLANRHIGLRYAVLRPEFAAFQRRGWCQRHAVAICLGGVDPSNATMRIAASLYGELPSDVTIRTLVGPGSKWSQSPVQPPVWSALYGAALAIVSPGTTLLECAATGTPALVVSHNEREHERAKKMLSIDCEWFRYLGPADSAAKQIRKEALALLNEPELRREMGINGRSLVDGCGAWRVGGILRRAIFELEQSRPPALTTAESMSESTS